jgi:hypothetical protein
MQIENEYGEGVDKKFSVSFAERRMSDIWVSASEVPVTR